MKKNLILILSLILIAGSCQQKQNETLNETPATTSQATQNAATLEDSLTVLQKFEGILPCADCKGIKVTITIYNSSKDHDNHFKIEEQYLGKKDTLFSRMGIYNTERGFENDNNATVYVLDFDKPENEQSYHMYYSKDPSTLHKLDANRRFIKSKHNYTLKEVK